MAAITVPSLVSACNKNIVETRLKSIHSTILQAFKMAQAQNGDFSILNNIYDNSDVNGYSWENNRDAFETYFAPVFNTVSVYQKNKCFRLYYADGVTYRGTACANVGYYVLLNNGTVLGFVKNGNYDGLRIIVILNPSKRNLIIGKDIFELQYMSDTYGNGYGYNSPIKRNYNLSNRQKFLDACKSTVAYPMYSMSTSEFCTFLIFENGFKIPKDYPVKL